MIMLISHCFHQSVNSTIIYIYESRENNNSTPEQRVFSNILIA